MDPEFHPNWDNFCAEQTPENLRIDKKNMRAWGYKRFTLANLLRFARRSKGSVSIHSPFISIRSLSDGDDDLSDDGLDAFCGAGGHSTDRTEGELRCKGITDRVVRRMLNTIGRTKTDKCMHAARALEGVPPGKLSFRYTAPVGANGPVCMMFRISNYTLEHECLERLNFSEGCRTVIVTLSDNMVILKLVLR